MNAISNMFTNATMNCVKFKIANGAIDWYVFNFQTHILPSLVI